MIETFTHNTNNTINDVDAFLADGTGSLEGDDHIFYNSIAGDLNRIDHHPKQETLDSILDYSKNYLG